MAVVSSIVCSPGTSSSSGRRRRRRRRRKRERSRKSRLGRVDNLSVCVWRCIHKAAHTFTLVNKGNCKMVGTVHSEDNIDARG